MAYKTIQRSRGLAEYKSPYDTAAPTSLEQVNQQVLNAQRRLGSVGVTPNEMPTSSPNLLMKGLELLDAPRNILWKTLGLGVDPTTGESSGRVIIDRAFGQQSKNAGVLEKVGRWVGATGLEILGDPLNYVTFGLGGLAKGAITGVGKTMTRETAEALAKSAVGELTEDTVQKLAREQFSNLVREKIPSATKEVYSQISSNKLSELKSIVDSGDNVSGAIGLMERYGTSGHFGKLSDSKKLELVDNIKLILGDSNLNDEVKSQMTRTLLPEFRKDLGSTLKAHGDSIKAQRNELFDTLYEKNVNKGAIEAEVGKKHLFEKLDANAYVPKDSYGNAITQAIADVNKKIAAGESAGYDDVYQGVVGAIAESFLKENGIEKMLDKGLTVVGKTIIPGYKLEDLGAAFTNRLVAKHPNLKAVSDGIHSVFNTKFIKGVDADTAHLNKLMSTMSKGAYNTALTQAKHSFLEYKKILDAMPDGKDQDKYIKYIIENDMIIPDNLKGVVNPKTVEIAQRIRDDAMSILRAEQQMGLKARVKLDPTYMHRTPSTDVLEADLKRYAYSTISDALNVSDVTGKRMYKTDFDTAQYLRKIDTSSELAKLDMADGLEDLKDKLSQLPKDHVLYNALSGFNAQKLRNHKVGQLLPISSEAVKKLLDYADSAGLDPLRNTIADILDAPDGIDKFYEESGVTAYLSMLLQHEKLIANVKERDNFLNVFAVKTSDANDIAEAFGDANKKVVIKGLPNIYTLKYGKELAEASSDGLTGAPLELTKVKSDVSKAIKSLQKKAIDAHGAPLELTENEYNILLQSKNISPEVYVMPTGAYEKFRKTHLRQMDEGMSSIGSLVDTFHRIWKPTVTGLRPDFHIRNLIGSTAQSVLGSGARALDPRDAYLGASLVTGAKDGVFAEIAGQRIPLEKLKNLATSNGIYQTMHRTDLGSIKREITGVSQATTKGAGQKVIGAAEKVGDVGRFLGNAIEDRIRGSYFITNLRKGMEAGLDLNTAARYAGDEVKRFHFDYSDLTDSEKLLLQRAMPFYTWSRKNIPLQLEMLLNEPRKYSNLYRAVENASDQFTQEGESELLPDYAKTDLALATPFRSKDNMPIFLSGLFPMSDIKRLDPTTYLKEGLGMLSPLAKMPVELGMNREILTGKPISQGYEGETVPWMGMNVDPRTAYLANQFGIFRNVSSAVSQQEPGVFSGVNQNATTRLLTMDLGNSVAKQLNIDKATENRLRAYLRDLQNQMQGYEAQSGQEIPTIYELNATDKAPRYRTIKN